MRQGMKPMTDPNLKIAMDKRDEALREAEGWEEWIRAYTKLLEVTVESHDSQKGGAKVAYSNLPGPLR